MKTITIRRLDLQFDANQITKGSTEQQARQALELINLTCSGNPSASALNSSLTATRLKSSPGRTLTDQLCERVAEQDAHGGSRVEPNKGW